MISFILNNTDIRTELPPGITVLDFVRYKQNLKGTKIGCREGDCGACTILVGELVGKDVKYRSMTSCLMPLANAAGKHIVTIEGINPEDGSLTPVQQAMVDESGTQCGFCTVGFVMSLTGACLDGSAPEMAISAVDGNICRCTGYKSIERAAARLSVPPAVAGGSCSSVGKEVVPSYFSNIGSRLRAIQTSFSAAPTHTLSQVVPTPMPAVVGGGTDLYVQRPEQMAETDARPLLYDEQLRGIRDLGETIEIGGSATVTDLLESSVMQAAFPKLYEHLKLISSTPIRNMATLAGNFVNASPIGDMTVWFLALDAELELTGTEAPSPASSQRALKLKDLYLGYKQLAKQPDEIITAIRFRKPDGGFRFNFEKISKRTYLDIATVNTAISVVVDDHGLAGGAPAFQSVRVSAGGVAPIPLYLRETSAFLTGREINKESITGAQEIAQSEISPISDVRGTAEYKRLLLRQLFRAHFVEMFGV